MKRTVDIDAANAVWSVAAEGRKQRSPQKMAENIVNTTATPRIITP